MKCSSTVSTRACRVVLVLLVITLASYAQSGRSWMKGFVLDQSDTQGLKGATIELIGDQDSPRLRAVKLSTTTDERGEYHLEQVPYGDYTFRASAAGFTPYEIKIYIMSDALTQLHVKLIKKLDRRQK